jgi:parvulin-like peptidyl-prolyl isomerase
VAALFAVTLMHGAAFAQDAKADAAAPPAVAPAEAAAAGPAEKQRPRDVLMARVGDEPIYVREFFQYVSRAGSPAVIKATTNEGKAELLREIIIQRLIDQAMLREGIVEVHPNKLKSAEYNRAMKTLSAKHFPLPPPPSEEDAFAYYEANRESFGIPELVRVRQVQFRYPENADEAAREAVRQKAEAAEARRQSGESVEALARELSDNEAGRVAGGDLGFLPRNTNPWLRDVLAGLKPGQSTGVIESPVGYEILEVVDVREPDIAPFANVRDRISMAIRQERQRDAIRNYARKLAEEIEVVIEMPELAAAKP